MNPRGWLKEYWPLPFMYAAIIVAAVYFIFPSAQHSTLFFPDLLILEALLLAPLAVKRKAAVKTARKYWASILIIIIVLAAFQVRLLDYRWPYLRNIDSYMFYRHMDYIIDNNGVFPSWDPLVLAPDGQPMRAEWYTYQYIGAYSYMFFAAFLPGLQLWQYLIYFPALLASLMAIPMYYMGKTIYDRKAGILAAAFVVFDFSNISRSLGGDPDSDAIVMLMPLVVMAFFLLTFKHLEKGPFDRKALLYTALTGLAMALWAHSWAGYWYVLWIITGMIGARVLLYAWKTRNARQTLSKSLGLIIFYVLLFVIIAAATIPAYGNAKLMDFVSVMRFQEIKSEEGIEFPNVYVSVAELQAASLKDTVQRTSPINFDRNPLAFLISPFAFMLYTIMYLGYSYYRKRQHFDTLVLLLVWFVGPFLSTLVAVRFAILFSTPMALGSAIILSKMMNMISRGEKLED